MPRIIGGLTIRVFLAGKGRLACVCVNKKVGEFTKKALRNLLVGAAVAVSLPVLVSLLLLLPRVQLAAVQLVADGLRQFTGASVHVGAVSYVPFGYLQLSDVRVESPLGDTFITAHQIALNVAQLDVVSGQVHLTVNEVNGAEVFISKAAGDSITNLGHFLNQFPKGDSSASAPWLLLADELNVTQSAFSFHDYNASPRPQGIDFNHLDLSAIHCQLRSVRVFADSVNADLTHLSFAEQSGFELQQFVTRLSVSPRAIRADSLRLQAGLTMLVGSFAMLTNGWSSYAHFNDSVVMNAQLNFAEVSFDELSHFAPQVKGLLGPISFRGTAHGALSAISVAADEICFGDGAMLRGQFEVNQLPDSIDVVGRDMEAVFSAKHLATLSIPQNGVMAPLPVPEILNPLGTVRFEGDYRGGTSHYAANGNLSSAAGKLHFIADLAQRQGTLHYRATAESEALNLALVLPASSEVGSVGFELEAEGSGTEWASLNGTANGTLNHAEWRGYRHAGAQFSARVADRTLNATLNTTDSNALLQVAAIYNNRGFEPIFSATGTIANLNPAAVGLLDNDTITRASADFNVRAVGDEVEKMHGRLRLSNLKLDGSHGTAELHQFLFTDTLIGSEHNMQLSSDWLDGWLRGTGGALSSAHAVRSVLAYYFPAFKPEDFVPDSLTQFRFELKARPHQAWLKWANGFELYKPTRIQGEVDAAAYSIDASSDSIFWGFGGVRVNGQTLVLAPQDGRLVLSTKAEKLALSNGMFLQNLVGQNSMGHGQMRVAMGWKNETSQGDSGGFSVLVDQPDTGTIRLALDQLKARIAGVEWQSTQHATAIFGHDEISVASFSLTSDSGFITANGGLGVDKATSMQLDVQGFRLGYLRNFGLLQQELDGTMAANARLRYAGNQLLADAEIAVEGMEVGGVLLGQLNATSRFDASTGALHLDAALLEDKLQTLALVGDYYPKRTRDAIDMELRLNSFQLKAAEPFTVGIVSHLDGTLSGNIGLSGTPDHIETEGLLNLSNGALLVDYLNTAYTIPSLALDVSSTSISFDATPVIDARGHRAMANGSILHDRFNHWNYQINLDAKNFQALNTNESQSDGYYGEAAITGQVSIEGNATNTRIEVDAATAGNSTFVIPLSEPGDVSSADFIQFVDRKRGQKALTVMESERSGLELDFKLSVNDSVEVQLVFDQKIGDIIKVTGFGDMLLQLDNRGKFNMYGDYTISGGDYLFTMQNVVNKRFTVVPGSRVSWNGSPYNAIADISAVYKLRAAPTNLMAAVDNTNPVYKQRMPVEVELMLKGDIFEPSIGFDVDLPSLPPTDLANQMLERGSATEQAINQQAFSLLLANTFSATSGVDVQGAGISTTYDMLSNQFSNWASQYFENWDVGIKLNQGQKGTTTDQGELSLSTQLFDDRLAVQVNGTVQGASQDNQDASNIAGEANIEYKINRQGTLRGRVFNKANNYDAVNLNQSPYTQGVGIFYQREFDTVGEFFKSLFTRRKRPAEIENE